MKQIFFRIHVLSLSVGKINDYITILQFTFPPTVVSIMLVRICAHTAISTLQVVYYVGLK